MKYFWVTYSENPVQNQPVWLKQIKLFTYLSDLYMLIFYDSQFHCTIVLKDDGYKPVLMKTFLLVKRQTCSECIVKNL